MDLSIKEKCLIATLVLTLMLFGNYFVDVVVAYQHNNDTGINLGNLIRLIIYVVIIEAIIRSFFALRNGDELEDERDKLIEKVSYRNGYWVMSIGVWFLIGQIFIGAALDRQQFGIAGSLSSFVNLSSAYILGNVLLFIFIVSEVIIFITQLFYYRRGV